MVFIIVLPLVLFCLFYDLIFLANVTSADGMNWCITCLWAVFQTVVLVPLLMALFTLSLVLLSSCSVYIQHEAKILLCYDSFQKERSKFHRQPRSKWTRTARSRARRERRQKARRVAATESDCDDTMVITINSHPSGPLSILPEAPKQDSSMNHLDSRWAFKTGRANTTTWQRPPFNQSICNVSCIDLD